MVENRSTTETEADVCLIVEGAYPFVAGGVSSWMHDLIQAQSHLTFHLLVLSADDSPKASRFKLPPNVIGMTEIALQQDSSRVSIVSGRQDIAKDIEGPMTRLFERGGLADFRQLLDVLERHGAMSLAPRSSTPRRSSPWSSACMSARRREARSSTISGAGARWQAACSPCCWPNFLAPSVYHAISTGYAGVAMARAVLTTGRPGILTEHGIYTNERRVEIAMADWLSDQMPSSLDIEGRRRDLRDVWIDAFTGYARTCYEACSRITTLYTGNQVLQSRDGAPAEKLQIIPNGVDYDGFSKVPRDPSPRRPTVALIGRVVPIKDVKTFIRASALLRDMVPDVRVLLLGPTDEDPEYFHECQQMVAHLGLENTFEFSGRVKLQDYLGNVDAIALTSISEAQPLVLLEAGAASVPSVATDVGSCREILHGRADEVPSLGPGGFVTPLSNPLATAKGLADLLLDDNLRKQYGEAIRARTEKYYNKRVVDGLYRDLYQDHLEMPERSALALEDV